MPIKHPRGYEEETEKPPLKVNERVVWMSDQGPEHGTVRWVGILKDSRDREWTVGVEFVRIIYLFNIFHKGGSNQLS